jgi:AraC family transcriptional regulator
MAIGVDLVPVIERVNRKLLDATLLKRISPSAPDSMRPINRRSSIGRQCTATCSRIIGSISALSASSHARSRPLGRSTSTPTNPYGYQGLGLVAPEVNLGTARQSPGTLPIDFVLLRNASSYEADRRAMRFRNASSNVAHPRAMKMTNNQIYLRARGATPERDEDAFDINRNHWPGLSAERVRISKPQELAFRFQGQTHFLALHDIVRTDGETTIDGFARSVRRDIRDTLTFVPAGASVEGWSKFKDRRSSVLAVFLDPNADDVELRANDLPPRLYFENPSLKQSVQKINSVMNSSLAREQTYIEHVGLIILCELRDALLGKREASAFKGGLTPQQLNRVRDYITSNLGKNISLSELAGLIHLSRFHFVRAFKKTTGTPPYQFVLSIRVERAKELLTESNSLVGTVARSVGFHGTLQLG